MKERPILFSAPMVKALLEGRKTQTRRIVKPFPFAEQWGGWNLASAGSRRPCPYGLIGDRLWVKETWALSHPEDDCGFAVMYHGPIPKSRPEKLHIDFRADQALEDLKRMPWRAAIHMPRWASRITLEITDVRVQRVDEISEQDALGEGVRRATESEQKAAGYSIPRTDANLFTVDGTFISISPRHVFLNLFYDINKRAPRGTNPWVWALTFKAVKS